MSGGYEPGAAFAARLDADDPLRGLREAFELPRGVDGSTPVYVCGHSLGPLPRGARDVLGAELEAWSALGVDGHFKDERPWYSYAEFAREGLARLAGARVGEVAAMNSLTVNLHLLMASFYRPRPGRAAILIEDGAFPSDRYAAATQIAFHGFDPRTELIVARPRAGEDLLREEDVEGLIAEHAARLALVLLPGVQYYTGQRLDIARLTHAAHAAGAIAGWDLAHAMGNVPLALHDDGADFAVWCSYKYLNAGPGAVAGAFVHERHATDRSLPRLAGWWGNDPATRFAMHDETVFVPAPGAAGWQVSNPPIFALAPLLASLALFDRAGMDALRAKSLRLTGYLEFLLDRLPHTGFRVITPRDPAARGCQLSLHAPGQGRAPFERLARAGVLADYRDPDVIRIAPAPLYTSFSEVHRIAAALEGSA